MMKKLRIFLFLFLLFSSNVLLHSEQYYYFYTSKQIKDNIRNNKHRYCRVLYIDEEDRTFALGDVSNFDNAGITPTTILGISIGHVRIAKNIIYCFDKRLKRTYKFKRINFYEIEALNHTAVFVKGTKIYLHYQETQEMVFQAFYKPIDLIYSNYWKTGIKNGIFSRYYFNTKSETLFSFKNNILLDSIQYSINDSISLSKKNKFLECYYKSSRKK
jgi:hypothetical protein